MAESVIYELHVKGFTQLHPAIPEEERGTFAALASDPVIEHVKRLGISAVQLLPVFAFNDEPHLWKKGLSNYWGYNPYCFFAPDPRYGGPREFRRMVRRFHAAGVEVLLDVVFNHMGEGDEFGPTLSLRGIDNASFYRLAPDDPARYVNDTGCGDMLDMDNEYAREMVLASLRYWAGEMGVDGFRFDLAPVLGRSREGFSPHAPLFEAISGDPLLSRLKMIAEPWDIGPGGYQLGNFPCGWGEWNDKYRDCLRSFWRGDEDRIGELAARLSGSRDIFGEDCQRPQSSINFIAAHDGFTLRDLVSYERRRNEANGEDNRDGHSHNISRNYGVEGESDDEAILALRRRQMRNMLASLFLSLGVPMLQAGDELGRTQRGNNNCYCQDNELSWLDWSHADMELAAFTSRLIALRKQFPQFRRRAFLAGEPFLKGELPDAAWFSPSGELMQSHDWELPYARSLAMWLAPQDGAAALLVLINAHDGPVNFRLPPASHGESWRLVIDSAAPGGSGDGEGEGGRFAAGASFDLPGRSLMVLAGLPETGAAARAGDKGDRVENENENELYGLHELGDLAGLASAYSDLAGHTHILDDEHRREALAAMRFDVSSPLAIDREARRLLGEEWRTLLPPVLVLRQGNDFSAPANIPARRMGEVLHWSVRFDEGGGLVGEETPESMRLEQSALLEGELFHRLAISLPSDLPPGYHHLRAEIGAGGEMAECSLIIAPAHCYRPPWLERGERIFGLACQLNSLRAAKGDMGLGDFSLLSAWARAAGESGADILGISPLHALFPDEPQRVSPYSPSSRLFVNPLHIDPRAISGWEEARGEIGEIGEIDIGDEERELVDMAAVKARKWPLFERLYQLFVSRGDRDEINALARWRRERGESLFNFTLFSALSEHFGGQPMSEWPRPYRDFSSSETREFARRNEERLDFHAWLQWRADLQLANVARECARAGMRAGLYGDLAVGAAGEGAERWSAPDMFLSDIAFGAPPDAFNSEGQNWAMPPFCPRALRRSAYAPFRDMLKANMRHCGALRIDHVMWLERMFFIPRGRPAAQGAYVRFPLDDLLGVLALESWRHECLIIGEDLGTAPLGFRERMEREGILSYRLMRFEKLHDGSFAPPHDYPHMALATPSSHDLPTLRGFVTAGDLDIARRLGFVASDEELEHLRAVRSEEIHELLKALARENLWSGPERAAELLGDGEVESLLAELARAVHLYLARSRAAIAMFNLEDIAGSLRQVNIPGTVGEVPNWRHRLAISPSALAQDGNLRAMLAAVLAERKGWR
jgi:glycogen operon protein